jgi:hypothetical protein
MKTLTAEGTILTGVFVTMDSVTDDFTVKAAAANAMPYGISGFGSRQAPLPAVTDDPPIHAIAGEPCLVHGVGGDVGETTVMIRLVGTVVAGDPLMPSTDGKAIKATTGKQFGAIADQGGASGDVIRCTPRFGLLP